MDPDYLIGGPLLALALGGVGLIRDDLTPEQRTARRDEAERKRLEAIAIKRANSPSVAAAEAKRARKAAKLRRTTP